MRILYLTAYVPGQAFGGSSIVSYNLLTRLARRHQITLLCHAHFTDEEHAAIDVLESQGITVHAIPFPPAPVGRWEHIRRLASLTPYSIQPFLNPATRATFDRLVREFRPDVIEVDLLPMAGYIRPDQVSIPFVFFEHNVETARYRSQMQPRRFMSRQWLVQRWECVRIWWAERQACHRADWVFAVTDEDAADLKRLYGVAHVSTARPGVDLDVFSPLPPVDEPRLVFAGSMFYEPNIDAMMWFHRAIWPMISERLPDVRLTIVGRDPAAEILALAEDARITVTGSVPTVNDYFANAAIAINPLRTGGGIKQKLLEAMAMQRAVVTTTFGCIGVPVEDQKHVLIADDPSAFAEACVWLLTHPTERAAIAHAARALIEQVFSWEKTVSHVEEVYRRVETNEAV